MNNENKIRTIIKKEIKKVLSESSQDHENIWYHTTTKENVDNILKYGLLINQRPNFSKASIQWTKQAYGGIIPIYLSKNPGKYPGEVILEINTSGLKLLPDLPSLVDKGAQIHEDNDELVIYFEENQDFMNNTIYEDSGEASVAEYLSVPVLIEGSINLTQTAAFLGNIPPDRINIRPSRKL